MTTTTRGLSLFLCPTFHPPPPGRESWIPCFAPYSGIVDSRNHNTEICNIRHPFVSLFFFLQCVLDQTIPLQCMPLQEC